MSSRQPGAPELRTICRFRFQFDLAVRQRACQIGGKLSPTSCAMLLVRVRVRVCDRVPTQGSRVCLGAGQAVPNPASSRRWPFREGPESWSLGLGLADPPFGTTEPRLRRFPRASLSAPALGRGPGRLPCGCKVRPWPRELALSALLRLEFGEALSLSLCRCSSRA